MKKFTDRVARLSNKIGMSQTPVPGFIMGLSGTDSVVAFVMCYDAMVQHGKGDRVLGIHYVNQEPYAEVKDHQIRVGPKRWFETDVIPWLQQRCPKAEIIVAKPLGGNQDPQRWADLHTMALNSIDPTGRIHALDEDETFWVVGTINATEKALGRYSLLADTASVQPLMTLYKSTIIEICRYLGVPEIAIEKSRLPDCLCGRDELAANNIELIDDILRFTVDVTKHDPKLLKQLYDYVNESQRIYGFKQRIPYVI